MPTWFVQLMMQQAVFVEGPLPEKLDPLIGLYEFMMQAQQPPQFC